ncbi:MAG: holo-ACP synthase [Bacilli bacterium]|nr:holo-ACP synthase [Bacilli bacterium]
MIFGVGTDLVEINRIKVNYQRLAERVLSEKEFELFRRFNNENRKLEFLAGRFAVKEAYAKALGTGIGELRFKDIEVLNDELGKPFINMQNDSKIHVSISHTEQYALAFVVIEE